MKLSYLKHQLMFIQKEIENVNCSSFQLKEVNQKKVNNVYNIIGELIKEIDEEYRTKRKSLTR